MDFDADGSIDQRSTYTYDGDGNRFTFEFDNDVDGVPAQREEYIYQCS